MITIAHDKKPDWASIRAEYIGGGISQRALAKKHGVSETTLMKKANAGKWNRLREEADSKAIAKAQQKTANLTADNATLAQEIRRELLKRLKQTIDSYPKDATEFRQQKNGETLVYKLVDIAKVYRDLTDTPNADVDTEPVKVIFDV